MHLLISNTWYLPISQLLLAKYIDYKKNDEVIPFKAVDRGGLKSPEREENERKQGWEHIYLIIANLV
jgi:hypothetical protein